MARRRTTTLPILLLLAMATAYGGTLVSSSSTPGTTAYLQATPWASPVPSDSILYEAVAPAVRDDVVAATDQMLSRYTISASFHPSGASSGGMIPSSPWASPPAAPLASPATVPAGGVIATPVPGTMTTPVVPVASPAAGAVASPAPADAAIESQATITGSQELWFVNGTGAPLPELYLRLYPNLRQYDGGRMVVRDITVDGVPVAPEPPPLYSVPGATPLALPQAGDADLILLRIPLGAAIPPGGGATVGMAFTTTVPTATPDGSGLFAFTPDTGTWALGHWFPILAGYGPTTGWELDPPGAWSDPVFSNTALFDVTLTTPRDLVLVTTGVQVEESDLGEHRVRRFVSGPVREFAIVADDDFASVSTQVGDTVVTSYYNPEDAAGGAQVLEWGAQSLAVFTELFGPYPYATLDLVAVPNVTGFEFPQLVWIGADFYADPEGSGSRPGAIEFLVAHEVSHQWWYGLVGSNPHRHSFLDEGLAEYSGVLYFERQHGAAAAREQLDRGLRLRYATMVLTTGDQVVDRPSVDFPDESAYYATVYRKGGLGFAALRREIGDVAFFTGLRDYAGTERFAVATPDDLRAAFERASGRGLWDFWHLWFGAASGRVEIVMEPAVASPAAVASPVASPVAAVPDPLP